VRVAYLVLSHRNPEQVLRLVAALREGPAAEVVVRHDERHSHLDPAAAERAGARLLRDEIEFQWGRGSQLDVMLRSLARVRELVDPDWLLVLSGQDYPLRPLPEVESFLAATELDAMLGDAWELDMSERPEPPRDEFFLRHAYRHHGAPRRVRALPNVLRPVAYVRELPPPLRPLLGIRRLRTPFGPGLRCHVSGDWLTLNRRALRAVLDFARDRPRLMRFWRGVYIPTESYFATVLLNDPTLEVARHNRRFVSFPAPLAPHPETLTSAELGRLEASDCDFARKFDVDVDATVLDALDERRRSAGPR
jgi:hypothetical protein